MVSTTIIFIDGQKCSFEQPQARVAELLNAVNTSTKKSVLVSSDGTEHNDPNELINFNPGEKFVTEECRDFTETDGQFIAFTVNGEACTTTDNPLTVETILQNAGPGAALDLNDLAHYVLENTANGVKYENLDDSVEICNGDNFIAIHVGSTPVAEVAC